MEEEDVGGSERGHDPHQPAHVTRPGTQLPQVQPDESTDRQEQITTDTVYTHSPRIYIAFTVC